jgi:hypothetical protein
MTDSLHQEPERDHFQTESPIRAFTDWMVQGLYALGKGFRPSLAHLVPYLDAMESKEGWRLVQILEAGTQTPSFLFRLERTISDDVLIDRLQGPESFKQQVRDLLQGEPPYPYLCPVHPDKIAIGLRQVAHDMMEDRIAALVNSDFADRIRGYALELAPHITDRHCGFAEAGDKIDAAREMSFEMERTEVGGHLAYRIRNTDAYSAFAESLKDEQTLAERVLGKSPALGEPYGGITKTKPMIPIPELVYWCDEGGNFYHSETHKGQGVAFYQKWASRKHEFPGDPRQGERVLARHVADNLDEIQEAMGTADDPINPKHYGGRECADIGELLTANSYQVLKYNWRLGEKDSPCVEIGKALWYLDSEMALHGDTDKPACHALPEHGWFDEKLRHASDHAKAVARILISWNRYGNRHSLKGLRKLLQAKLDTYNGCENWEFGEGLKP